MSRHLEKAKAALEGAKVAEAQADYVVVSNLLSIAHVFAAVAQAEALERIAAKLDAPTHPVPPTTDSRDRPIPSRYL